MNNKWYTTVEYVDRQTGEMISEQRVIRENYKKIKTTKQILRHDTHNENRIRWECEKDRQCKLEL